MSVFLSVGWSWWRNRLLELAIALFLASTIIQISEKVSDKQKDLLPASAWFVVNEIYVPDHEQGSNPVMVYDRTIRETFNGFWIAEVQRKTQGGLFQNACSGSAVNEYSPDDFIESNEVEWSWFLNNDCELPPGMYRIKVSYTMAKPDWPEKQVSALSNEFKVFTSGSQP